MGFVRRFICCGCACAKPRPQYKQHVLRVFPRETAASFDANDPAASQPQDLSSLVHYALSYPEKLSSIGRYLHKCISRDIRKNNLNGVRVGIAALNALIDACHSDLTQLTLYDVWIIKCALLLFNHSDVELRILATETFRKLVHYQDEWSDYRKLDVFFDHLVALCVLEIPNKELECRARVAGLESMSKMVLFTDPQNTVDNLKEIIPAVFFNLSIDDGLSTEKEEQPDDEERSKAGQWKQILPDETNRTPQALARECLCNIGTLGNLNFIELITVPIFKYLDGRLWKPLEFSLSCIRTIADNSQLDHGYGICYLMLRHLDDIELRGNHTEDVRLDVQVSIVQTTAELVLVMKLDIGPWQGLINFLLQRLESAVEQQQLRLRDALIVCVSAYCVRLPNALDVIDIIGIVVEQIDVNQPAQARASLECALCAARLRRGSKDEGSAYDRLISDLLSLCAVRSEEDVPAASELFVLVHEVIVNLAIPFAEPRATLGPRSDSSPEGTPPARKFGELSNIALMAAQKVDACISRIWSGSTTDELAARLRLDKFVTEQQQKWSHVSVHRFVMMDRVGSAALMVSYFRTLLVLLSVRPQPALLVSIPMLFSWLDANPYPDAHAVNEAMSESKLRSYRIHLLCAAYLLGVSRVLTRLDSLRAAVELDEIASAAIERVLTDCKGSALGLLVSADKPLHEVGSTAAADPLAPEKGSVKRQQQSAVVFDRQAILRALQRLSFPGLDAQQVREVMTAPVDSANDGLQSPRRYSVSVPIVFDRSLSMTSDVELSSSTAARTSAPTAADTTASRRKESELAPADIALQNEGVGGNDVQIVVEKSISNDSDDNVESPVETTIERPVDNLDTKPFETFVELTKTYKNAHRRRISTLAEIGADDDSDSVLSELLADDEVAVDDVGSGGASPATSVSGSEAPPSPSTHSLSVQLVRHMSRSSVRTLPDTPLPMLSAERMLSSLDSDSPPDTADTAAAADEEHKSQQTRRRKSKARPKKVAQEVSLISMRYPPLSGLPNDAIS